MDRIILHSDCNNFFASVECAKNPEYKNVPLAVSGDRESRHGIILAKNEIAKSYGVKFFSTSALRYADEIKDFNGEATNAFTTGGGSNMEEYIIHQIEMVVKCLGVGAEKVCFNKVADCEWVDVVYTNGKSAKMMFAPCMPFAITVTKNDGKSAYMSINSEFFKGLIADIFNFFQTGDTSFDTNQTLEIMKVREAVIKAKSEANVWLKV